MSETRDADDRTALAAEFVSRCRTRDGAYRLRLVAPEGEPIDVVVRRDDLGSVLGLRTGEVYRFEGLRRAGGRRPTDRDGDGDGEVATTAGDRGTGDDHRPFGMPWEASGDGPRRLVADDETRVGGT